MKLGPISFDDAVAALGEPRQSGFRIATGISYSVPAGTREKPDVADLLGSERWFIWDCYGVHDDFDRLGSVFFTDWGPTASERTQRTLTRTVRLLQELHAELFCIAVEDRDMAPPHAHTLSLVSLCSRHR